MDVSLDLKQEYPSEWIDTLISLSIDKPSSNIPFILNDRYSTHVILQSDQNRILIDCCVSDLSFLNEETEITLNNIYLVLNHAALKNQNTFITIDEYQSLKLVSHIHFSELTDLHIPSVLHNISSLATKLDFALLTLTHGE